MTFIYVLHTFRNIATGIFDMWTMYCLDLLCVDIFGKILTFWPHIIMGSDLNKKRIVEHFGCTFLWLHHLRNGFSELCCPNFVSIWISIFFFEGNDQVQFHREKPKITACCSWKDEHTNWEGMSVPLVVVAYYIPRPGCCTDGRTYVDVRPFLGPSSGVMCLLHHLTGRRRCHRAPAKTMHGDHSSAWQRGGGAAPPRPQQACRPRSSRYAVGTCTPWAAHGSSAVH